MVHQYAIGQAIKETAAHHASAEKLWETKWKRPATMGVYPFMFGAAKDFEGIFQDMTKRGLKEPYDWDEYAECFRPKAEELVSRATKAEKAGNKEEATELFLRASAVYRISRFPCPRSEKQKQAWTEGKKAFYKGQSLMDNPITEIKTPHRHAIDGEGDTMYFNWLCPPKASASSQVPLIIIITGLDGYRTELAVWQRGFMERGVASVVAEIPGTGDSPAKRDDPTSPDRQWSTLFDYLATRKEIDQKKIIVWGFSTGGFYALRLAHTHANNAMAVISFGGGAHHCFDSDWLSEVNHLEYPFDLCGAFTYKWGYGTDQDKFRKEAHKYSLKNDGTLDKPHTKILLVNGMNDEIFPIDDMDVALQHGGPKLARQVPGRKHMGEPEAFFIILKFIFETLGMKDDGLEYMKNVPFKSKYD